jgi:hypothetical protein
MFSPAGFRRDFLFYYIIGAGIFGVYSISAFLVAWNAELVENEC